MAINYPADRLPMGDVAWATLLGAIEASQPTDETDWLEHKAGLDPSTKPGGAALAKAIVAFANRAQEQAERWLGGYGLVVVGLEPGNVPGTPPIDPAVLHDQIDRYLAPPAPLWDSTQHVYKGQNVLVVTVAPPRPGDPIALASKDGADVVNGHIYVRRAGKSEPAKHEDLRRLEARLLAGGASTSIDIRVEAAGDPAISRIWYPVGWIDRWTNRERARLLEPLKPSPPKDDLVSLVFSGRGFVGPGLLTGAAGGLGSLGTKHDEDRTEDEFRAQVAAYLELAEERLPQALDALRSHYASELVLIVHNNSTRNFKDLKVRLHVEGDVSAADWAEDLPDLAEVAGEPPRKWGPWTDHPFFGRSFSVPSMPSFDMPNFTPRPEIENGGSVAITFPVFNLRPGESHPLDDVLLYADEVMTGTTRCTWTATATNVDAVAEGDFSLAISNDPVDVTEHLS